jgi:hypothetical protein
MHAYFNHLLSAKIPFSIHYCYLSLSSKPFHYIILFQDKSSHKTITEIDASTQKQQNKNTDQNNKPQHSRNNNPIINIQHTKSFL